LVKTEAVIVAQSIVYKGKSGFKYHPLWLQWCDDWIFPSLSDGFAL